MAVIANRVRLAMSQDGFKGFIGVNYFSLSPTLNEAATLLFTLHR